MRRCMFKEIVRVNGFTLWYNTSTTPNATTTSVNLDRSHRYLKGVAWSSSRRERYVQQAKLCSAWKDLLESAILESLSGSTGQYDKEFDPGWRMSWWLGTREPHLTTTIVIFDLGRLSSTNLLVSSKQKLEFVLFSHVYLSYGFLYFCWVFKSQNRRILVY